jgi:hypothetical protein
VLPLTMPRSNHASRVCDDEVVPDSPPARRGALLAASTATITLDVATKTIPTDSALSAHGLEVCNISAARAYHCVKNGPKFRLSPYDRAAGPPWSVVRGVFIGPLGSVARPHRRPRLRMTLAACPAHQNIRGLNSGRRG